MTQIRAGDGVSSFAERMKNLTCGLNSARATGVVLARKVISGAHRFSPDS